MFALYYVCFFYSLTTPKLRSSDVNRMGSNPIHAMRLSFIQALVAQLVEHRSYEPKVTVSCLAVVFVIVSYTHTVRVQPPSGARESSSNGRALALHARGKGIDALVFHAGVV